MFMAAVMLMSLSLDPTALVIMTITVLVSTMLVMVIGRFLGRVRLFHRLLWLLSMATVLGDTLLRGSSATIL